MPGTVRRFRTGTRVVTKARPAEVPGIPPPRAGTFDILNATSLDDAIESTRGSITAATIVDVVTGALIALGALVLIVVMIRIERRSQARDAEVRAVAGV